MTVANAVPLQLPLPLPAQRPGFSLGQFAPASMTPGLQSPRFGSNDTTKLASRLFWLRRPRQPAWHGSAERLRDLSVRFDLAGPALRILNPRNRGICHPYPGATRAAAVRPFSPRIGSTTKTDVPTPGECTSNAPPISFSRSCIPRKPTPTLDPALSFSCVSGLSPLPLSVTSSSILSAVRVSRMCAFQLPAMAGQ